MLTKLKAYGPWAGTDTLLLDDSGTEETDLIQIRNIDGLDPVKASVNTSPFGSVDGAAYVGSGVTTRNIVLTIHPNPDWIDWTYEKLRKLIYSYFMPKQQIRLVFESDIISPVEIYGYVESIEANPFSKDPEILVSVICPDPYFRSVDPVVVTGVSDATAEPQTIEYNGDIEVGLNVEMTRLDTADAYVFNMWVRNENGPGFWIILNPPSTLVTASKYFALSSVPGNKFVHTVDLTTGATVNLLSKVQPGSIWPTLQPGSNEFFIEGSPGNQDWKLTYYETYGGL